MNLYDGKIEDQSSTPGPTNVEINYGPFIGRKKEIYQIIKKIRDSQVKMIQIQGNEGLGKTRLVKEVANFINKRRIIEDGVYYLDFKKANSQQHINEIFKESGIENILQ